MEPFLVVLFLAGSIWLIAWSVLKTRRFQSAYRYDGSFDGLLHHVQLQYPQYEHKIICRAGANPAALFLLPDPEWKPRSWLRDQGDMALDHGLRIPWSQIECRRGRVMFGRCVWFEVKAEKTMFYLPEGVALQVLSDAGRALPPTG
jgi:hypothetical protein